MKDEEILKLYGKIYKYLSYIGWTKPEIDDLQSYMVLEMLGRPVGDGISFRISYLKGLKKLYPRTQDSNRVDDIAYKENYDSKIEVEKILKRIPSKDRLCVLKFMYDRDKSSNKELENRRRRIFTEIREREEDVL